MYELIAQAIIVLAVVNILSTPALWLLGRCTQFWSRGRIDPNWASALLYLKWDRVLRDDTRRDRDKTSYICEKYWRSGDIKRDEINDLQTFIHEDWEVPSFMCDLLGIGAFAGVSATIIYHNGLTGIIGMVTVLSLVFGPRFLMDISHSIRYNFKEREADRLKELEAKVAELENK